MKPAYQQVVCLTDLGGKPGRGKPFFKDINWNSTRPTAGLFIGFLYQYSIGARLEVSIGKLTAADSLIGNNVSDADSRYQRNLHFRSKIAEVLLMIKFHPLSLLSNSYEFVPQISPYILAGAGWFSFNPEARFQGNWISLQPLRTEGSIYKTTQLNFPAGAGLKYELSALVNARLEAIYRFLQTDYLDDVSSHYFDPAGGQMRDYPPNEVTPATTTLFQFQPQIKPGFKPETTSLACYESIAL